jgi:hypothetical protein
MAMRSIDLGSIQITFSQGAKNLAPFDRAIVSWPDRWPPRKNGRNRSFEYRAALRGDYYSL